MNYLETSLSEIEPIVKMNSEVFTGMYEDPPYTLEQYRERISDVHPRIIIAHVNGELAGNCISFKEDGNWYIWILAVKKQFRNQGIAEKFLDMNERYAKEHDCKKITAKVYNVSKGMLRILLKRDFDIVDFQPGTDDKYNCIFLSKNIAENEGR